MSDFIEIHWTSGSLDEARKVSRYLVQEGIVANAQIIPWFESIYLWNGALETTHEKVKEVVLQNSKYEVPEITYYKIEGANEAFQEWMSVATNPES
jgi:periplasmic divalent cation tolerance protein